MTKKISYIFVLLAAFIWASTPAVGKLLLSGLGNLEVLFFTNLFAFLGLFSVVLFQRKKELILSYSKQDYFSFALMGFLGVFLYTFFLYGGLQLLPAQEAFIINYLWPVMVVVFGVLILKEEINLRKISGIILSFSGVVLVITKGNFSFFEFNNITGVLSAIAGAIVFGLFSVLGKKQNYDKFTSMMFYYFFGFIYTLIAVLLFPGFIMPSFWELLGLIWLGVFTSGLAFVFWFLALEYGDTARTSNLIFLTPFISLVYIYFLVGEKILFSSVAGLAVIVAGILVQSLPSKK